MLNQNIEQRGFITWHFLAFFVFTAMTNLVIIAVYLILWYQVHKTSKEIRTTLHQQSSVNSRRLAFKLSLYVVVYGIQFGGSLLEGLWVSVEEPPLVVRFIAVLLSVSGGILNGLVYLTIRKT